MAIILALCCATMLTACSIPFELPDFELPGGDKGGNAVLPPSLQDIPEDTTGQSNTTGEITTPADPLDAAKICIGKYEQFSAYGFCCDFEITSENLESQLPAQLQGAGSGIWYRATCCSDVDSAVAHTKQYIDIAVAETVFPDYPSGMMAVSNEDGFYVSAGAVGMIGYDLDSIEIISSENGKIVATCPELDSGGEQYAVATFELQNQGGRYVIVSVTLNYI